MKPTFRLLAGLLALLALTACGPRETPVERANRDGILLKGNGGEPASLDPHLVSGVIEMNLITALLEGLVRPHPATLEPMPAVAESWEVSEDGRVYTFHLRPEATWSNGDPVTAEDFVFSYQRMLSPRLGADYASLLYPLKNAEAYHRGELTDFGEVGVKALDPGTLEITLESPTPYFLSLLTHIAWFPLHPPTILTHGEIDQRGTRWARPGTYVGNGPFTLSKWSVHEVVETVKNPNYWDADQVRLNGVNFYPIDNLNTEERAYRAGQLHLTDTLPLPKVPLYREERPDDLYLAPKLGVYYYLLNTARPPLDNPLVRRALTLAIDRDAIAEHILRAGQLPARHFTPPNTAGYTARDGFGSDHEANIAEARRLLAEAGYPDGEGLRPLEILYNTSESHKTIAETIQRMWLDQLGVRAELINQDWKVYLQSRREGDFDVARASWIGDYLDPNTFLDLMAGWNGNNHSGWANPAYDALIAEAARTAEPTARYVILREAEDLLLADMPVIPIYFYVSAYLRNPAVHGWYPNLLEYHPYQDVWLEAK